MRRVAVTGIGLVCPLGDSADEAFAAARAGRSAVRLLQGAAAARVAAPLAAPATFDGSAHFDPARLRTLDRATQFAIVAARRAAADAEWAAAGFDPDRAAVFMGTGMGGSTAMDEGYRTLYADNSDRIKPALVLMGMHNAPAAWIAIEHGCRGPNLTYSTACSSSAVAIGEAWDRIRRGDVDVAFAGGAEAPLSTGSLKAWEVLRTLAAVDAHDAAASCKPFDARRSGLVLGEGAAVLVLEPLDAALARGATLHGEVLGYGLATDIDNIARPSVAGQAAAMAAALRAAGITPGDIDSINAHGTGTLANDAVETAAVKAVFGARAHRVPISATKAVHGHLLGAAGALEAVLSLRALSSGVALPTAHLRTPDPACDLDYVPGTARADAAGRTLLSNSFAFGGTNAVLVLRRVAANVQ